MTSLNRRQPSASWKRRRSHPNWREFHAQCIHCHSGFRYYAATRKDRTHDELRFCSFRCAALHGWSDKRKLTARKVVTLYLAGLSIRAIAVKFNCAHCSVYRYLRRSRIRMRPQGRHSARAC